MRIRVVYPAPNSSFGRSDIFYDNVSEFLTQSDGTVVLTFSDGREVIISLRNVISIEQLDD